LRFAALSSLEFLPRETARDAEACPHAGKSTRCLKIKNHLMAGRRPGHPENYARSKLDARVKTAHEEEKGISPDALTRA
jgi:hypothetical protein